MHGARHHPSPSNTMSAAASSSFTCPMCFDDGCAVRRHRPVRRGPPLLSAPSAARVLLAVLQECARRKGGEVRPVADVLQLMEGRAGAVHEVAHTVLYQGGAPQMRRLWVRLADRPMPTVELGPGEFVKLGPGGTVRRGQTVVYGRC